MGGPATPRARRPCADDHGRDPGAHARGSVTPVLVDSNVLLDVATADPVWSAWSSATLERIADEAVLIINPLVYAEVSVGFPTIGALDAALPADPYRRADLPHDAAFLAGKCFIRYRRGGGGEGGPPRA